MKRQHIQEVGAIVTASLVVYNVYWRQADGACSSVYVCVLFSLCTVDAGRGRTIMQ